MRQAEGRPEIDTPAKRARLEPHRNPYWANVAGRRGGLTLGYRKSLTRPGSWIAKAVLRGRRFEETFGTADDKGAAEGSMGFAAAKSWALDWARQKAAEVEHEEAEGVAAMSPTVRSVCEEYLAARRGGDDEKVLKTGIGHVLRDPAFSSIRLSKLTSKDVKDWRDRLPKKLQPSSVNRILNDVRAALNMGADTHSALMPAKLSDGIRKGAKAHADATVARKQILKDEQTRAIIEAAFQIDADFGRLTLVLAASGARFSQVAALRVRDVKLGEAARIMMPSSHKGDGEKENIYYRVAIGLDVEEMLVPILEGRDPDEFLLMRSEKKRVGPFNWEKGERVEWRTASNTKTYWQATKKAAGVPDDTIMYALRHTSIVRAIRSGIPLRMVAAMHDTSTSQIEKHYSAFILDVSDEIARRAIVPLAPRQQQAAG